VGGGVGRWEFGVGGWAGDDFVRVWVMRDNGGIWVVGASFSVAFRMPQVADADLLRVNES